MMEQTIALKEYELSKAFKRDIAKLAKVYPEVLVSERYTEVFSSLLKGEELPAIYRDHALSGEMEGMRDCHIFSDLILIYAVKNEVISFIRLGSHADIFK